MSSRVYQVSAKTAQLIEKLLRATKEYGYFEDEGTPENLEIAKKAYSRALTTLLKRVELVEGMVMDIPTPLKDMADLFNL